MTPPPTNPTPGLAELREAVEPFLEALSKQQGRADSEGFAMWGLTMAHLRRLAFTVEGLSARSGVGGEDSSRPGSPCADAQERTGLARPEGGPCVGDPEAAAGDAGVRSAGAGGGIGAAAPAFRLALRRGSETG